MASETLRAIFVVNPHPIHVGAHLLRAASELGIEARLCNVEEAFRGSWLRRKFDWHFREHKPTSLEAFSREVVRACESFRPHLLLATGLSSLEAKALEAIGEKKILRLNFLTDDPWNPSHRTRRNLEALRHYDWAFTPRRANLDDLRASGCGNTAYLPFAYDPGVHFIDPPSAAERSGFACDLMFAGACDDDRVPYLEAAIRAGLDVSVHGIYWERHAAIRSSARGQADMPLLRKAILGAKVNLCLVRRANRDGHSMRTFEIPAIGGCVLAERTAEHEEILGREGETVTYFESIEEMVEKARWLVAHDDIRGRLADALHRRIENGGHTYRDRLATMLETVGYPAGAGRLDKARLGR